MGFKWQIPIGKNIAIPFKRRVYKVGLTQLLLESDAIYDLDVLHVVTEPKDSNCLVWLSDTKCLSSIKSFTVSGVQNILNTNDTSKALIVDKSWLGSDVVFHKIDLSNQKISFCVSIYNQNGELCPAKGFCVFDIC